MAILTRILNILIVLGAIAAAVFSYLLFERRHEFRGRADKLANTLAEVSKTLDPEAAAKINEDTLGWKAYHDAKDPDKSFAEFDTPLNAAKTMASQLDTQRETLVDTLVNVGGTLGIPQDQIQAETIKNYTEPDAYQTATDTIVTQTKKTAARDKSMIKAITTSAQTVGQPIPEKTLINSTDTALAGFTKNIAAINTQSKDYGKLLSDTIRSTKQHKWKTNPAKISDRKAYKGALNTFKQDLAAIDKKLVELSKSQGRINALKAKLEDVTDELSMTREDLQKTKKQLTQFQETPEGTTTTGPQGTRITRPVEEEIKPVETVATTLEGSVLQVNRDWNFVILNLGLDKVKEDTEMLVARDDDFIARVKVTKVLRKICIAEILPGIQTSSIKIDDRVIMPGE